MGGRWDIRLGLLGLSALLLSACGDKDPISQTPLPWDYPLMPGDSVLWETLTEEEQRRALAYLSDGSTIRSSLNGGY